MKPMLSIVYVYYNTPDEIRKSIKSLERTLQAISYEIIIVDNASVKSLHPNIYQLSNINIIRNKKNYGYGKGLNCGSRAAQGKYLLLVNPDVEFTENSIKYLLDKLESNSKIGIIGPQLMDGEGKILQSISGMPYLPEALFIFSFISKIWPNNPFSSKYNNIDLDRNREQNVDVVGGACLMISRKLFIKAGGLDEDFFMYFEEADFCFRVKKMGYKVLYLPKAKVVHLIGRSTQDKEWIEKTFEQSRFIFFKKYHGLVLAVLAELVLRFIKPINLLLMLALALSIFLNFYRISERMIFIGDQGWFYISARDMILTGKIPLVGITSSHTWLHQGPLWTYLLAFVLWAFNYNPLSGAYFTAFLNIFTVFLVYKLGKKMFSKRVGLIAALLYATSPLVIVNSHMPYHTSPIPLLVLGLIYSIYRWVKGNAYFLPLTIFILALLYNFELATQVIWVTILIIFILGFIKKKKWAINILNKEIWFLTISLFILPMLPIIIYDVNHNFAQTLKFFAWIPYRAISQLAESQESLVSMINFFLINYQQLIFASNYIVSFLILLLSIGYFDDIATTGCFVLIISSIMDFTPSLPSNISTFGFSAVVFLILCNSARTVFSFSLFSSSMNISVCGSAASKYFTPAFITCEAIPFSTNPCKMSYVLVLFKPADTAISFTVICPFLNKDRYILISFSVNPKSFRASSFVISIIVNLRW